MMGAYKTRHGDTSAEHALIYKGNIQAPKHAILFRINSACYTSDIFGDQRCDCHWQLGQAMLMIHEAGEGLIIYHLHHEGRAAGFTNKLKTYKVMEADGKSTYDACNYLHVEPDQRRYNSSTIILQDLGIKKVKLLTNNLAKKDILIEQGLEVVETIPLLSDKKEWRDYLISKRDQFGHKVQFDKQDA